MTSEEARSRRYPLGLLVPWVLLGVLTWGELRVLGRHFSSVEANFGFVLESVRGVLSGTPVFKSWQQRLAGPWLVHGLAGLTGDPGVALRAFLSITGLGANALLFSIARKGGASAAGGLLRVAAFALCRIVFAFRLEYPWDELDVLLFLAFGWWVSASRPLLPILPVVGLATLNHETILYVPAWYVISAFEGGERFDRRGRQLGLAAATALGVAAVTAALRRALYIGQPALPGQVFEPLTPVIVNPTHVVHNLRQLLVRNWSDGRAFESASVLSAIALLVGLERSRSLRTAAVWSLVFIATVVVFGYVNETRHYLPLFAFWFGYARPEGGSAEAEATSI